MAQRTRAAIRRAPKRGTGNVDSAAGGNPKPEIGPSGNGGNDEDIIIVDPAEARDGSPGDSTADSTTGRRGRTPGSKNRPKAAIDIAGIEKLLFSIHVLLASGLKTPELALDVNEARELASATAAVAAYYPVAIDPKTLAWANLLMVAGAIYGTRAAAIYVRVRKENETPQPRAANIHELNPRNSPMSFQAGPLPPTS